MKYMVREFNENIINGSTSGEDEWDFESYERAKIFFDEFDMVSMFETKDERFVVELVEYENEDEFGKIIDSKSSDISDID